MGPAIGVCCYEIGADVSEPLIRQWGDKAETSLQRSDGRTCLDLRGLNAALLAEAGVPEARIALTGPCTACNPAEFFSYRRQSKNAAGATGRQASFIGWSGARERGNRARAEEDKVENKIENEERPWLAKGPARASVYCRN